MANLHISVEAEKIFSVLGFPITNSFLCTLILSGLLILFALWYSSQEKKESPANLKVLFDMAVEALYGFFRQVAGKKALQFFPLLATFFFFIILANWTGLLPGMGSVGMHIKHHGQKHFIPFFRGPTADLNTTIALATISVAATQYWGIKYLGWKTYLKKFFDISNPINLFIGILELVSEFSKIVSYSFRLFGNIFAGEVLLSVMGFLIPFLAPLPFLGLEVFVGFIQALVFTMLSLVFWTIATEAHGSEDHNPDHQKHQPATEQASLKNK